MKSVKDIEIYIILSELMPIEYIRVSIIDLKNQIEREEALEYHIERYKTIYTKYQSCLESARNSVDPPYSYILETNPPLVTTTTTATTATTTTTTISYSHLPADQYRYIAFADSSLLFYNETGISHQVKELLNDIIRAIGALKQRPPRSAAVLKERVEQEDKTYGHLSRLITDKIEEKIRLID